MKKLSHTEISEFCNEFALFICRLRCPSEDWLLKMERAIKGVAGLEVTDNKNGVLCGIEDDEKSRLYQADGKLSVQILQLICC